MVLKKNERIDDLQCHGLMLIQNAKLYKFTTDSVLLANFAKAKRDDVVCEFCAGSGVVSLLIEAKNKCKKIYEIEIQKEVYNLAKRNIILNNLDNRIEAIHCDATEAKQYIKEEVDVLVMNPPYFSNAGFINESKTITKSRHEEVSLNGLIKSASKVLKFGGKLYMVQKVDRLVDTISSLRENKIEPKVIRFVQPKVSKPTHIFLVEGIKGGQGGIKVLNPLILLNEDNTETEEVKEIYNRRWKASYL